jgi:hypothetical protein
MVVLHPSNELIRGAPDLRWVLRELESWLDLLLLNVRRSIVSYHHFNLTYPCWVPQTSIVCCCVCYPLDGIGCWPFSSAQFLDEDEGERTWETTLQNHTSSSSR